MKPIALAAMLVALQAGAQQLTPAPVARSNWAVARVNDQVFTFNGLGPGKTSADIEHDAHALDLRSGRWRKVGELPVTQGRLASVAVTVAGVVYVIGGYTVAANGEETSTPEVLRFKPDYGRFELETLMPVPVDDTVAMPWRDRWIVLVSGWHDNGNVTNVQLYDTKSKLWTAGTKWPDLPVFGHAGGLVDDTMVICDGVTATEGSDGKHHYAITSACWQGVLDPQKIGTIRWTRLPAHPGAPLYRAGAVGATRDGIARIVFAGGSSRPYNYNGIGYDHQPSEPSAAVFAFHPWDNAWRSYAPLPVAGMDFRGLVALDQGYALFGGMRAGQQVSADPIRFTLTPAATAR